MENSQKTFNYSENAEDEAFNNIPSRPDFMRPSDPETKEKSDGTTASYYQLPEGIKETQDIISYLNLNAQLGEILRSVIRYGRASHSDKLRDIRKIKFYADAEEKRILKYESKEK